MYKTYFEETFFNNLGDFLVFMKEYYIDFYNNTGLENESDIIQNYINKYDKIGIFIIDFIEKVSKTGVLGRKILRSNKNIEYCTFSFKYLSYKIKFSFLKDNNKKEIIINSVKITT